MGEETARFTGGCLCGALRYEARGKPRGMALCYCNDCRKASGSGFIPVIGFDAADIAFSGESRSFASTAWNGGEAVRNFCPVCGGLVFGGERGKESSYNIYAGSLDDPALFQPTVAIFTCRRPPWALLPPGVTAFERMPGEATD